MASNKLLEAAAEILSGSKNAASAMPPEKIPAEVHDAGGPTPQNYKNDDNSAKISPSSKSAAAPTTKPSAASSKMEEVEVEEEQSVFAEDIKSLFADDSTISEEFKEKVSTIFEARVSDRVAQIEEETETRYAGMLEEAVEAIRADLTEKVDDYLSYVVEQWMEENQIAIQEGLRSEITEEFISGLRNLFAEHYIDVPAEKVDLVDELASKVEELETSLNEEIERGIQTKKALVEARKAEIIHTVCEGLIATQVEKIKTLAESVEFSTEDEYTTKLETIRENYFPSGSKRADEKQLHEELEGTDDKYVDPMVAAVAQAISKTRI
jgi:hypothetical protein